MALILNKRCEKCGGNVYRDYDEQAEICLHCGKRTYYTENYIGERVRCGSSPEEQRDWCELHGEDYNELRAENNFRRI